MKNPNFKVMLAHGYDPERLDSWDYVTVEPKVDGIRVIVLVDPKGKSTYYSRNGRELFMFTHLDTSFSQLAYRFGTMLAYGGKTKDIDKGVMFDGEMTAKTFGDIAGAIHRKDHTAHDAKYLCFHAMPLRCFKKGSDDQPQHVRQSALEAIIDPAVAGIKHRQGTLVGSDEHVQSLYKHYRKVGYEGAMVKNMSLPWIGARSHAWMKMKAEETLDLRVVGIKRGTGKYARTCGAIIVDHKGVEVPVSGMTDTQRNQFWKTRNSKDSIMDRIVEIEFQQVTVHGSLRHPRFKRIRDDK